MNPLKLPFSLLFLGFALVCSAIAQADVRMPQIFGTHMVLQQESKLPIWGWADAGEEVSITLGNKSAKTTADTDGKWRIDFPPFPPDSRPLTLTVVGKNSLTFTDILLGDVWIASGQSNMEIPMGVVHNAATEIPKADDPQLRYFVVNAITTLEPETGLRTADRPGRNVWIVSTPTTTGGCSGVSYFFARSLRQSLHRPIGMINSTFYSSAAEAWTPVETIEKNVAKDPMLHTWLDDRLKAQAAFPPQLDEYNNLRAAFPDELKHWKEVELPEFKSAMNDWNHASQQAKAQGQTLATTKPVGPIRPELPRWPGAGGIQVVGNLFNGMIAPIIPYSIKGVVWYQGEANAGRAEQYKWLLPAMIDAWREKWGEGDFPFLLVQLACYGRIFPDPCPPHDNWQLLREAQYEIATEVKNSGIATALDVGDPNGIHPRDKMDVGNRTALVALHQVYGKGIVSAGPTYQSMKIEGNKIRISFTNTGGGLVIAPLPWIAPGQPPVAVDVLHGFAIAGNDEKWVWAQGQIDGNDVVVWSDKIPEPVAVRYAWANSPVGINFYNKEMLPAFPFRTDKWTP